MQAQAAERSARAGRFRPGPSGHRRLRHRRRPARIAAGDGAGNPSRTATSRPRDRSSAATRTTGGGRASRVWRRTRSRRSTCWSAARSRISREPSWTRTSSTSLPTSTTLGRAFTGAPAGRGFNLVPAGEVFIERLNQIDFRVAKLFRFGTARARASTSTSTTSRTPTRCSPRTRRSAPRGEHRSRSCCRACSSSARSSISKRRGPVLAGRP